MKGLEIKFSEVGITSSANPKRKAMYIIVANVIDDKGKKHRHYLDIDMVDSKKVPISAWLCPTGFTILVKGMYYAYNEAGERLCSFSTEEGNMIQMNPDFIVLRKGNEASFYSHSFELKGSRPLTPEEIASLDEEKA